MSRHIRLVLLGGVPGLIGCAGCCGCGGTTEQAAPAPEPMEEVEEIDEDPPPVGSDHLIGAPFIAWWAVTHPPIVTHRLVPRAQIASGSGGYTRTSSGIYRRTYYGRSSYLFGGYGGGSSYRPGPAHSSPVTRGGFGSTGHASSGGGS
jgi:hypothetical protein